MLGQRRKRWRFSRHSRASLPLVRSGQWAFVHTRPPFSTLCGRQRLCLAASCLAELRNMQKKAPTPTHFNSPLGTPRGHADQNNHNHLCSFLAFSALIRYRQANADLLLPTSRTIWPLRRASSNELVLVSRAARRPDRPCLAQSHT